VFTVLVADEELIFAEALTSLLQGDGELRVLPAVSTAKDLGQTVTREAPDVVIVGSTLGSSDGSVDVPRWARRESSPRVLMVGGDTRVEHVSKALQSGASGWVAKDASSHELLDAVHAVAAGEVHLPAGVLTPVVRNLADSREARHGAPSPLEALTHREREVLDCMVDGLNREQMSKELFLSPNTVRTHMQNVLRKLDVHSSLAAAAYARRHGITGHDRDRRRRTTAP
jgi:DNA-binding NarL/FixJ family response regulator